MNKNEESLIEHALKLYGMQYNDNIESGYSSTCIEVGDRNLLTYSIILYLFNGTSMSMYESHNTSSTLNVNIRSFINHWMQYFNFNKKITSVAVCKCSRNTFDIAILCNDNCWYNVLISQYSPFDSWISYNW